jgi:GntR family transcriptional regulator/MocR family aminotransferase
MASAAAPAGFFNTTSIDRTSRVAFYQQLYEAIQQQIASGVLVEHDALPSIDAIAGYLHISRSTVRRAFDRLRADSLIIGSPSEGYRVLGIAKPVDPPEQDLRQTTSSQAFDQVALAPRVESIPATAFAREKEFPPEPEARVYSFNRVSVLDQIDLSRLHAPGTPRPFRPGLPSTEQFPIELWEGLRARVLRQRMAEMLDFSGTFGYLPLRQAIAARLRNARGVKCSPEQVIICAGAQQALNLVINTLVSPGDSVGLEEPGYYGVKAAFLQAGAKIRPLLVDEEGLTVPDARRQNPPHLIYTSPTNQFPLGAALSLSRRLSLLAFARVAETWIIEDDSDGDFSYMGRPLPSLQGSDEQNRVIYLGTTGKTLFSSLEIGYVVVPLSLMESFSKTKEIMGGQPCVIDQAVLAMFIAEGHFDRHLQRMNIIYHQRLQALGNAVESDLRGFIDLEPASAGLHAVGWLARGLEENVVADGAARAGVELPLLSSFGRTALVRPGVVFGFASFSERMIRGTVAKFSQVLKSADKYPPLLPEPSEMSQKTGFFQRLFAGRSSRA